MSLLLLCQFFLFNLIIIYSGCITNVPQILRLKHDTFHIEKPLNLYIYIGFAINVVGMAYIMITIS